MNGNALGINGGENGGFGRYVTRIISVSPGDVITCTATSDGGLGTIQQIYTYFIPPKAVTPPQLNENYYITETDTGKKWIDGKTIYRRVFNGEVLGNLDGLEVGATQTLPLATLIPNIDTVVDERLLLSAYYLAEASPIGTNNIASSKITNQIETAIVNNLIYVKYISGTISAATDVYLAGSVEYTKTTD